MVFGPIQFVSLALLLTTPVVLWYDGLSTLTAGLLDDAPPGQTFYVLSKLMGLLAITLAGIQLLVGYTLSSITQRLHIVLGTGLLVCALSHWLCFSMAGYQRTESFPWHLLQPWTDGAYYHTGILFGALALWMLLVIVLSGVGSLRRYVWAKALHRMGVGVFVFALVHAWMIGSEATGLWGKVFLMLLTGLVMLAMLRTWSQRFACIQSKKQRIGLSTSLGIGQK